MARLNVQVVHSLPGRLRLKLSNPPLKIDSFLLRVKKHEGIEMLSFNPISRSLLAIYVPSLISATEILLRVTIALSVEFNGSEIKMDIKTDTRPLNGLDYYSGMSILVAGIAKLLNLPPQSLKWLNYNAGFSTTGSVLKHAWLEVKKDGIYDPEVVSVVFLINSLFKGNVLIASAITWIATFGRHLLEPMGESCLLKAQEVKSDSKKSYIDVQVREIDEISRKDYPIKVLVHGLAKIVGVNPMDKKKLIDQIKRVSKAHHDVLEGVGKKSSPVYMRIEY